MLWSLRRKLNLMKTKLLFRSRITWLLVCVALGLLGARIEYLRRWGAFHKGEAEECLVRINAYGTEGREPDEEYHDLLASMLKHTAFSSLYEYYAYHRPWTITDESAYDRP